MMGVKSLGSINMSLSSSGNSAAMREGERERERVK